MKTNYVICYVFSQRDDIITRTIAAGSVGRWGDRLESQDSVGGGTLANRLPHI